MYFVLSSLWLNIQILMLHCIMKAAFTPSGSRLVLLFCSLTVAIYFTSSAHHLSLVTVCLSFSIHCQTFFDFLTTLSHSFVTLDPVHKIWPPFLRCHYFIMAFSSSFPCHRLFVYVFCRQFSSFVSLFLFLHSHFFVANSTSRFLVIFS